MPHGTLANLANSAFVRTPPSFAARIVRCLLSFPIGKTTNILDPTAGEGDLLVPCLDIPYARLYGVEISVERTAIARTRLPHAELVFDRARNEHPVPVRDHTQSSQVHRSHGLRNEITALQESASPAGLSTPLIW